MDKRGIGRKKISWLHKTIDRIRLQTIVDVLVYATRERGKKWKLVAKFINGQTREDEK